VQSWVPPIGVIQEIPAISPLRGNNPAMRRYLYHPFTAQPITYEQHYLNLTMANAISPATIDQGGGWALEYDFKTEYKIPGLDVFAWNELYLTLRNDIDQYHTFFSHRSSLATLWDEQKPELQNVDHHLGDLCAITNLNKTANTAYVTLHGWLVARWAHVRWALRCMKVRVEVHASCMLYARCVVCVVLQVYVGAP
jgi:hypothetical protein